MSVLEGLRVVELGVWIAGPAASGMMADWGAEVIKVESPVGDPQRHVLAQVGLPEARIPAFEMDNRGKRSIALDLKTESGRADMMTLLASADVFITNVRVKSLRELGLDPESVRKAFPSLVFGLVTGYGSKGPDADRAGYDIGAFWARSGAAASMTELNAEPPGLSPAFGDHATATTLVAGVCAALVKRASTGEGALVETSLLRTGMYCNSATLSTHVHNGKSGRMLARHEASNALLNPYAASDGRYLWLLCLEAERHWPNVVAAVERPEWLEDERYDSAVGRYKNRRDLIADLDAVFATRTFDEWSDRLAEFDVWWTPMNGPGDMVDDPQVIAVEGFVDVPPSDMVEPIKSVASAVDFDGVRPVPPRASPEVGEHTAEIAAEFGLSG